MGQLEDMTMFIRIVEAGGVTKAADALGLAKSAVSRRLSDLESRLGSQLLTRTTRKSSLTEAGTLYYRRALNILDEVDRLNEQTSGVTSSVEGLLRMTAPLSFGLLHLSPVIDDYAKMHPDLRFQLDFTDRHVDLVEEGYELALRIGDLPDSSFQAKRITAIDHVFCASPDYLKKHGTPQNLAQLKEHAFLHYSTGGYDNLHLTEAGGKSQRVEVNAKMRASNGDFLRDMAIQGHGITYLPTFLTYQAIASGALVPLLTDFKLTSMYAYAIYPKNRFLSQRCRLLIDFIAQRFGDVPYWDR